MGKHEVGTPKYIANKIKAKGLQKLRWYCQMCEKQCRDENGFKCHTMSESHHRQLLLFADNQNKYMDQFSKDFSHGYLQVLKRQFGTKRVPANRVYQEYIADRNHVHMNATMWLTLTAFVKWLGRTGKCVVDETEKGWFITYIDRDPDTIAAQEKKEKKEKMDKDDQERMMTFIEKQVKKGKMNDKSSEDFKQPLEREDDVPLVLDIKLKSKKILPIKPLSLRKKIEKNSDTVKVEIKEEPVSDDDRSTSSCNKDRDSSKRKQDIEDKPIKKLKKSDNEDERDITKGWLKKDLSVKIITKSLGEKFYKAKGVVKEILDKDNFVAKVKLTSSDEVRDKLIKIDQEHLESVIPAIDREVMILWGKYEDEIGIITKVRIDDYCADVELKDRHKLLKRIPYEQICKYIG